MIVNIGFMLQKYVRIQCNYGLQFLNETLTRIKLICKTLQITSHGSSKETTLSVATEQT
jgi:hypothetical protein